ncbi:hypothetical protein CRM22_000139 [Opisthorchis felineus]|uniref:Cystatin domain-containing protein n=1 Tax=Opisthorchis felineus TaxID=147828 RepID=A0A4V3SHE5_OPIFE|nr:hypothetical protein CRM22_000139 [Opisthorchis felineus]
MCLINMYAFFLFACCLGFCLGGIMHGGKKNITELDAESFHFGMLLRLANLECNKATNFSHWFVEDGGVKGTKEDTTDYLYEFEFEQKETVCDRQETINSDPKPACNELKNGVELVCSVEAIHGRFTHETEVKVTGVRVKNETDGDNDGPDAEGDENNDANNGDYDADVM